MDDEIRRQDSPQQDDAHNTPQSDTPQSDKPSEDVLVDWDAALEIAADDPELLLDVLDAFQSETPQMVRTIRQSLEDKDVTLLHRAAHTVKNACLNIGAQQAGDVAFELEMLAKNEELDQIPPLLGRLESLMEPIEQEVARYISDHGKA